MSRVTAAVRPATSADLEATVALWEELREESTRGQRFPDLPAVLTGLAARLTTDAQEVAAGRRSTCQLAVAYDPTGAAIGMCLMRVVDGGPLTLGEVVLVDVTHVAKPYRRSGVGRQLLGEVVRFAAAAGVEDVVAQAPGGARDLNRFLAGWGFAAGSARRGTSVGALRRRLGPDGSVAPVDGLADLTQLQRLLRRRAVLGARLARPPARSAAR